MPKKNVREMGRFEKLRYSLGAKTFRAVLIFAIIIGLASLTFSFLLYNASVRREFKSVACNLARTATMVTDKDKAWNYAYKILKIYDEIPDEIKADPFSEEYRAYYSDAMDEDFMKVRMNLHNIEVSNNAKSVFLGAVDVENERLIYLIDSDYTDTFCPPGRYEDLDPNEIEYYLGNGENTGFDLYVSGTKALPAYIGRSDEFGYLCTAADQIIAGVRGYKIMTFADVSMDGVASVSKQFLWQFAMMLIVIAIIVCAAMTLYLRRRVVIPVNKLANAAESYRMNKRNSEETGAYFSQLDINTGDEIENLSLTMKDMEKDISEYEANLTRVIAEKERIGVELNIGRQIQESMIPHIYPAFPERKEFDVFATMTPAKEIGGDFYDFFLIDENHLGVVMADVSGKGIPAALFMMICKILIKNFAGLKKTSPARILEMVNEQVCQNNEAEMFVTVWLGILEISTGKMTCANAGHEYPVIRHQGGAYELLKDPHGFVVGGMEGIRYKNYDILLQPGSSVFVYTDGVTEAADEHDNLFGMDRMVQALNESPDRGPVDVLENMKNRIQEFAGDADQFDDITMMSLIYYGPDQE